LGLIFNLILIELILKVLLVQIIDILIESTHF
jgi:hypothetical protein